MMRRRIFFGTASLCFLQGLDRAGFSRASGGAFRREPTGANLNSLRDPDSSVVISPDGRWVATAENDCSFKVWDGATGALVWTEPGTGMLVKSLAFSRDGRHLAIGGRGVHWRRTIVPFGISDDDDNVLVRDEMRRLRGEQRMDDMINAHSRQVKVLDLEAKKIIVLADSRDGIPVENVFLVGESSVMAIDSSARITRWDTERADDFRLVDLPKRPGEALCPRFVALDGDGRRLAAIHQRSPELPPDWNDYPSSRIRLVDVASRRLRVLDNYGKTVWSVAISRDGAWVAAGNGDASGLVTIWDYEREKRVQTLHIPRERGVPFLAFSPDGAKLLTSTEQGDLRLWDWKEGRLIRSIDGPACQARAVAFMGARLRVVSGGVRFLKPAPGANVNPLEPLIVWDEPAPT